MSDGVNIAYLSLLGLAFGSFLNVCILRLPAGGSIFRPRSACPACGHQLSWYENIPVLSYLALRGRCGSCGGRISIMYPLVELGTAVIWVGSYLLYGGLWGTLHAAAFGTILLGIAVTDAREYIIPDEFSVGGLVVGLALAFAPGRPEPLWAVVGAGLSFGLMYGVAVVGEWAFKKPALGGGDIKMMAMVGAFLGPLHALLTIFVGSLVGALIFGPISLKTKKLVPFGVFLALGAAVVYIWGDELVRWYATSVLGLYRVP
jgi:leader peptidase (prepilin peptidase)/N-methyltransferase